MKASQVMRVIYALAAGAMPVVLWASANGPDPRYTGAPGDKDIHPFSCASAGCHAPNEKTPGKLNFYGGSVSATFSQGSTYTPGTPVTITVSVSDPINKLYGFQMTARRESNLASAQAGRFVPVPGVTGVLCDDNRPRSQNGNCSTNAPVEFIEHVIPAPTGWTFTWTPPATAVGPVHFYLAGNAVNGNGHEDDGDHPYTTEYVLTPALGCTSSTPSISAVISAGAFGARTDFTSGTWLEIYGSNFANGLKLWDGPDFNGLSAPTVLDQVKAQVNGKDAYTWVVSPGQLNVQAPDNAGTGPMNVTVTNCDKTSAPMTITQKAAAPGVWAPPSFTSNGKQLLGATTADGKSFIGNIAGLASRPAKPGEMIIFYGVGFGATNPAVAAGQITAGLAPLSNAFVMTVGGVTIPSDPNTGVVYAGLSPGFVGLYQFNIIVPNVPDGDQPVTIRVGPDVVPQTLFLSVKR